MFKDVVEAASYLQGVSGDGFRSGSQASWRRALPQRTPLPTLQLLSMGSDFKPLDGRNWLGVSSLMGCLVASAVMVSVRKSMDFSEF